MTRPAIAIAIREIASDDAADAARLSGDLGYPVDEAAMRLRIGQLAGRPGHGVFVATVDGTVVGWIHVSAVHHLQSEPRAEIGGLIVDASVRSAGIGSRLVARAEQWALDQRLAGIVVRSQIMREAAHRFYLREGYERTKTSAVFSKALVRPGAYLGAGAAR